MADAEMCLYNTLFLFKSLKHTEECNCKPFSAQGHKGLCSEHKGSKELQPGKCYATGRKRQEPTLITGETDQQYNQETNTSHDV